MSKRIVFFPEALIVDGFMDAAFRRSFKVPIQPTASISSDISI